MTSFVQLYPEQLRQIADFLEGLNKIDLSEGENPLTDVYIGAVPLKIDDYLVGYAVDEVGGSWMFVDRGFVEGGT